MSTDLHKSDDFLPSPSTSALKTTDAFFDSVIGQSIGNFKIEKRLGAGAMAAIYRAVDGTTNQAVALKLLSATADEILRTRFVMEARLVRTLQHPHIVQILDAGQTEQGLLYIAMTLIDGEDLGTFLERRQQLNVLDSCRILQPIADALAHAHKAGIVHRDVKPGNILLHFVPLGTPHSIQLTDMEQALIPLLSDFGIARALDAPELTTAGRTIGTPAYMSPEQCAGNRLLDGRADIYSLGTVLYRCLVGRAPFIGATTQILHAHVYESILIPERLAKSLPLDVKEILQQALQKEPEARYGTADELAADLEKSIQTLMPSNATVTMPALPVVSATEQLTDVLVPGVGAPPTPGIPTDVRPPTTKSPRTVPSRSLRARRLRRPTNWAAILLGILLSAGIGLVLFAAIIMFGSRLGPLAFLYRPVATTVPAVTGSGTGAVPTFENAPAITGTATFTAGTPLPDLTAVLVDAESATGVATNADPVQDTETPTAQTITPTVSVVTRVLSDLDVGATWRDVQYYYQSGDWGQARWNLITMLSAQNGIPELALSNISPAQQAQQINDELITKPGAAYWGQWIDTFTLDEVSQTLADVYMGLANEAISGASTLSNLSDQTYDYLVAAATVRPPNDPVRQLTAAISRYLSTDNQQQKAEYFDELVNAYLNYASNRNAANASCAAAQAMKAAQHLANSRIPTDLAVQYESACQTTSKAQTETPVANPLSGTIYYSAQAGDLYSIWRVSLTNRDVAALVLNNASQPSLFENKLAFYSRRSDSRGLSGVELSRPIDPNGLFPRYTNAVEDAEQSPARWNPTGSMLVFSSKDGGDHKPRLYAVPAEFLSNKSVIDLGEDPIWSPDGNAILYRDTGIDGNAPGLFLRPVNGAPQRLTSGDDRRPIWTPDGKYVIFMRNLGDDNWELFRMRMADGVTVQLTNNPAQDGLPALNPAGDTVAFASDREGQWNLWTIPLLPSDAVATDVNSPDLSGDQAQFLMPVQGAFLNWLEHSIQWVN